MESAILGVIELNRGSMLHEAESRAEEEKVKFYFVYTISLS